jgi:hypothetical protein
MYILFHGSAFSYKKQKVPGASPAAGIDCINLNIASKIGANIPNCAYVGRHPIKKVGIVITKIDHKNAFFRPSKSPIRPKIIAPNGRVKNPVPNITNALIKFDKLESKLKNNFEIMGARYAYE